MSPPASPFFSSRWVSAPEHVRELPADAGLPAGFRAAGVACGIKPSGRHDLGLLVCDSERAVSAARFTASSTAAAPVLLTRSRCELGALRAFSSTPAARTPPRASAASMTPPAIQLAAAGALGVPAGAGRARLDGRHQPPPAAGRVSPGSRRRAASSGARARATSSVRSNDRRLREAGLAGGVARRRPRALERAVQGRRHDLTPLRHMLCFLETDAALGPSASTRCSRARLRSPSSASPWTGSSRRTTLC